MKKLTYNFILSVLIFSSIVSFAYAQSAEEKKLYDFSQNWLRYDKYYESYVPIKNDELRNSTCINQIVSVEKYKDSHISFQATKGLSFFVNNKLYYKKITDFDEVIRIPLSKIERELNGEVVFTFFNANGILPIYSASISKEIKKTAIVQEDNNKFTVFKKAFENQSDLFILFLFILSIIVLFKQMYPKEYLRYYKISFQESSDHLLPGTFSIPSLLMSFINSLIVALLIYLVKLDEIVFNSSISLFKGTLYTVFFYSIFFIGKYVYLSAIAWLFNYSKIVALQFSAYIRFFEISCLLTAFIMFGITASGVIKLTIQPDLLYFSLIIVLILSVVKVIFLFFRLISHRNLYLFSYICAAEILPLIITVKILLF